LSAKVWKSCCNGQRKRYFEAALWHSGKRKTLKIRVFIAGLNEKGVDEGVTGRMPILPLEGVHWRMLGFKCKTHPAKGSAYQWILQLNSINAQARVG
jgi:hypothetical protein